MPGRGRERPGLIVTGGCYLETCTVPSWRRLYGSGTRAAAAVAPLSPGTRLHAYCHRDRVADMEATMRAFGATAELSPIDERISFSYFHPMSRPHLHPSQPVLQPPLRVVGETVLRFGFVEGEAVVDAHRAIYDPQGGDGATPFRANGSRSQDLAVVMNQREAEQATGLSGAGAGHALLGAHTAEVVVIKRGCEGAWVFECDREPVSVPAYRSERVFKIGSGDVFSAGFALHWGERGMDAPIAADLASRGVAAFVDYHALPLPEAGELADRKPFPIGRRPGRIYLAGPFFDIAQRWLIEEALEGLDAMGVPAFSPLHEVGMGLPANETAAADLAGLDCCAAVLALADGADPGTVFEIGYALGRGKPVVVLSERGSERELATYRDGGCHVATDLASALYHAAWAAMA